MVRTADGSNLLLISADEFSPRFLGAYGHEFIRTPRIDSIAGRGACFTNAYTSSPICVPARATIATGRYVHEIGTWDNCHLYEGQTRSWAHELRDRRHRVISFCKLHYRNATEDTGFDPQVLPMHINMGVGDLFGALRDPLPEPRHKSKIASQIGRGESAYAAYDNDVAAAACSWLESSSQQETRP
jgi:choline-sulfatase